MSQNSILLFDDIFYLETCGQSVICHILDDGVLQMRNLGTGSFSALAQHYPWPFKLGEKGFLVNFNNVINYCGLIVEKGRVNIPLEAPPGEVLVGSYPITGLRDFENPFTDIDSIRGGSAIVFREVPIANLEGLKKLTLVTPAATDVLDALQERQKKTDYLPGIRLNYIPAPPEAPGSRP